tara:strand:- start:10430 stop:10876 length:447 start_codon:yes stop_codon:yes gene_type:complete
MMSRKTISSVIITMLCLGTLGACTPTISNRGNLLEPYQIEAIKVGQSTRSEVLRTLGSPTIKSTFDTLVWYYIGQETKKHGILDPEITDERIYRVVFNDEGVLENFELIDKERMHIPYVREKTPTHGNERTIAQEFLGNIGKFNPPAQ